MLVGLTRILCALALVAALWPRDATTVSFAFHVAAPPVPPAPAIVLPTPAPPPAHRPSCPPPRTDAPRVAPALPEEVTDVAPAPTNAGWIAAWNDTHVFVSYDAGASWSRVLDGDGHVLGASFDCFGRAVVLRGNRVGVAGEWHAVGGLDPDAEVGAVIGGGPDVVVTGRERGDGGGARVAISSDAGATWGYRDLDRPLDNDMKLLGRQRDDGTIEIAYTIANCMDDILDIATLRGAELSLASDSIPEGAPFAIDDHAIVAEDRWRPRAGSDWHELDVPGEGEIRVAGGAFTIIARDHATYRFDRGKLRRLPFAIAGTPRAVDPAGRVWSIAGGRLAVSPSRASTSGSAGETDRR